MSKSGWIIAATLGLAASFGQAQENETEPEVQPEATQQQPAEQTSIEPPLAEPSIIPPANEPSNEHNEGGTTDTSEEPYQYSEVILGDGWAQWIMAFTGLGALLVSIWAVRLLSATLKVTREAVASSDRTVALTGDIGQKQVKAYAGVTDVDLQVGQGWVSITPTLRNFGQTPAYAAELIISGQVKETTKEEWPLSKHDGYPPITISPNVPTPMPGIRFEDKRISGGIYLFILTFTIRYGDVFDKRPHRTVRETWVGHVEQPNAKTKCQKVPQTSDISE